MFKYDSTHGAPLLMGKPIECVAHAFDYFGREGFSVDGKFIKASFCVDPLSIGWGEGTSARKVTVNFSHELKNRRITHSGRCV
jgi:hypothetical protein